MVLAAWVCGMVGIMSTTFRIRLVDIAMYQKFVRSFHSLSLYGCWIGGEWRNKQARNPKVPGMTHQQAVHLNRRTQFTLNGNTEIAVQNDEHTHNFQCRQCEISVCLECCLLVLLSSPENIPSEKNCLQLVAILGQILSMRLLDILFQHFMQNKKKFILFLTKIIVN